MHSMIIRSIAFQATIANLATLIKPDTQSLNMKKALLVLALVFSAAVLAQETPQTNSQLSANLLIPSLEYEVSTGAKSTLKSPFGYRLCLP